MKVNITNEQIRKLERLVNFSIEDESDLEQAISLFIETHKHEGKNLKIGSVVVHKEYNEAFVLALTTQNTCTIFTKNNKIVNDVSIFDVKDTGRVVDLSGLMSSTGSTKTNKEILSDCRDRGMWAKQRLLSALLSSQGYDVVLLDDDKEYESVCEKLGVHMIRKDK